MQHKIWIKALDLVNWSDRRDGQEILPRLIRKLIYASCRDISYCSFPADESVQRGGWDGILKGTIKGNEYVPQGDSVWEFSVRNDKIKADEDYEKRTENPKNVIQKDTTYIFITSRQYTNKDVWVKEKKEQNKWKDVRYYDANDLEQWLDICPAVNYWFSRLCGKQPDDVVDLEEFWENFSKDTRPYITPDIIVNDRSEEKQKIISWFKAPPSQLLCSAESKKEAIAFLISVIKQLTDNEQYEFFSKSLIVKNYSSWKELLYFQEAMILIPDITEHVNINIAIERGHYVFLPAEQEEISNNENSFILNRLKRNKLEESLQAIGLSNEEARDIAGKSGGSLTYLRLLLLSPDTPEWIEPELVSKLVPFILVGQWNDNNKKDIF